MLGYRQSYCPDPKGISCDPLRQAVYIQQFANGIWLAADDKSNLCLAGVILTA